MKLDKTCACCNDNCHRKAKRLEELLADYERDKKQLAQLLGTDPIHDHMMREAKDLTQENRNLRQAVYEYIEDVEDYSRKSEKLRALIQHNETSAPTGAKERNLK